MSVTAPEAPIVSPVRIAITAVLMPFFRPRAFARAAGIPFLCWTGAVLAATAAKYGFPPHIEPAGEPFSTALNTAAIILALAGCFGVFSFDVNWQRIAYQWPMPPEPFPMLRGDGHRRSQFRLFGRSKRKVSHPLLRGLVVHAAAFVLLTAGLIGVVALSVYVGAWAGSIAFFSLPVIMLALESSLDWPNRTAEAVHDSPAAETGEPMPIVGPMQRAVAYFLVYGAIVATLAPLGLSNLFDSDSLPVAIAGMSGLVLLLLLSIAWLAGVGALLYAQRRTPARVFD